MVDSTAITTTKAAKAIHCLTLPLFDETILLPNAAIAEVVTFKSLESMQNGPQWFLGYVNWRDYRVPLISFESISGKEVKKAKKNSQIAILNTLNGNTQLPYIGLLTQGIPSLAIVKEDELKDISTGVSERPYVGAYIDLAGIKAIIPSIDEIEQRIVRLHL